MTVGVGGRYSMGITLLRYTGSVRAPNNYNEPQGNEKNFHNIYRGDNIWTFVLALFHTKPHMKKGLL